MISLSVSKPSGEFALIEPNNLLLIGCTNSLFFSIAFKSSITDSDPLDNLSGTASYPSVSMGTASSTVREHVSDYFASASVITSQTLRISSVYVGVSHPLRV